MKKLIFLKAEYLDLNDKKVSKVKEQEMRRALCQQAIKQFKKEMKSWIDDKLIKITKEYDANDPQVVIQCDDNRYQEIYEFMLKIDVVTTIDSMVSDDA